MYCNVKSWNVVTFKYENVAYYRKHRTGFVHVSIWGSPIVLCLWVSYFWVFRVFPSSPFSSMDLNQWRAPLSVESLLSGGFCCLDILMVGLFVFFIFFVAAPQLLCSCSPAGIICLLLIHSPPSFCTFFMNLTSLLQNVIWVESYFVNTPLYTQGGQGKGPSFLSFQCHAEGWVCVSWLSDME